MSKVKYSKVEDEVSNGWCTFYQSSNYIAFSFCVRFDENGNVDVLSSMEKRESKDGSFYVADFNGNITEQEFNEALLKALEFVTKRNCAICITTNLREQK